MRIAAFVIMAALVGAMPLRAQDSYQDEHHPHRVMKVLIGAGALAIGATVAAKSSNTTRTTSALGITESSSFSTSQLVTGLAIAGTGGIVLWDGLRDHRPNQPSTTFGVSVGPRRGLFVRRSW
jgi:hypothetical protein